MSGSRREIPWSDAAELSVLGAILIDGEALDRARDLVSPDAFYKASNRRVFEAMIRLHDRGEAVDVTTLRDELKSSGDLEAVGGMSRLAELVDAVPGSSGLESWARTVRERKVLRDLIQTASSIADAAYSAAPGKGEEVVDRAEQEVLDVARGLDVSSGDYGRASDYVFDFLEQVDQAQENRDHVSGLETGFSTLDAKSNGLAPGSLTIVAGRPSHGKTAWTLQVAREVAIGQERPVAIFSLEMPARDVVGRMICGEAQVPYLKAKRGKLAEHEYEDLSRGAGAVNEAPVFPVETTGLTIHGLRSKARRIQDQESLDLLIVDYLQLMSGPSDAGNREREVGAISRALKDLALELDVPVIGISQLSRAPENRAGSNRPRLSDLRDSGSIEQDADLVLFVYREELYVEPHEPKFEEVENQAELIIGKQRNGPLGTVPLWFDKGPISFRQRTGRPEEGRAA